jgi:hypothetical protein
MILIHHGPPNSKLEDPKMREEPQKKTRKLSNRPSSFPFFVIATFTSTPIPRQFHLSANAILSYYLLLWAGHAILPHHDLGAVRGDPLQLSSVFQYHFLHKLDRILKTTTYHVSWQYKISWPGRRATLIDIRILS